MLMYFFVIVRAFSGSKENMFLCSNYISVQTQLAATISIGHPVCGPLSLEVISIMLPLSISEIGELTNQQDWKILVKIPQ